MSHRTMHATTQTDDDTDMTTDRPTETDDDPPDRFGFAYEHPRLGDDERRSPIRFFERLAARTDRSVEAVEAEFHRKHRYVRYMRREGMDDFEDLFGFLADLRNDEAATVERIRRTMAATGD